MVKEVWILSVVESYGRVSTKGPIWLDPGFKRSHWLQYLEWILEKRIEVVIVEDKTYQISNTV